MPVYKRLRDQQGQQHDFNAAPVKHCNGEVRYFTVHVCMLSTIGSLCLQAHMHSQHGSAGKHTQVREHHSHATSPKEAPAMHTTPSQQQQCTSHAWLAMRA
jgi:hypothetical protein